VAASTLEAAGNVDAVLRASVPPSRTLIHVRARPPVGAEPVASRARADEAAGRVAACVRAGTTQVGGRRALVHVRTAGARRIHLVADVAQAAVGPHRVDAASVDTGTRHHATLIQICQHHHCNHTCVSGDTSPDGEN